jgi:hypothetical protein
MVPLVGYALPVTDMFFKYLFALGIESGTHLERFILINGPDGASTVDRFQGLLGPMTSRGFTSHQFGFSEAGDIFKDVLAT